MWGVNRHAEIKNKETHRASQSVTERHRATQRNTIIWAARMSVAANRAVHVTWNDSAYSSTACFYALRDFWVQGAINAIPGRKGFVAQLFCCALAYRLTLCVRASTCTHLLSVPNTCILLNKPNFQLSAEVDLLSVENGGVEVACNNHHYGEPKNIIKVRVRHLLSAVTGGNSFSNSRIGQARIFSFGWAVLHTGEQQEGWIVSEFDCNFWVGSDDHLSVYYPWVVSPMS